MARGASCRFSGQAIMCVQLLSWCVAACLLLYRGVTTLRKEPALVLGAANSSGSAPGGVNYSDSEPALPKPQPRPEGAGANALPAAAGKDSGPDWASSQKDSAESPLLYPSLSHMSPAPAPVSVSVPAGPARLRHELRPASLILIVLGFSMLLVGPVVIVLRKCDSTLHQRRAAKLASGDEEAGDLPPSYEEATTGPGGAGAPRYSSLFEVLDSGELVCLTAPLPAPAAGEKPGRASPEPSETTPCRDH